MRNGAERWESAWRPGGAEPGGWGATDQRHHRPRAGVLLVGPEPGLTRQLAAAGFAVTTARTGPEALRAIARHRPDVVVLDLDAAAASGLRLLRRLKRAAGPAPVLALTALDRRAAQAALLAGADDFLMKPLLAEQVASRARLLARTGGAGASEGRRAAAPPASPPAAPAEGMGSRSPARTTRAAGKSRVLVVEDEPAVATLEADILGAAGLAVTVAPDGEAALAALAVARPDLVVLDLQLPRVSGFRLLELLKGDPATAAVPVLVVTALDFAEARAVAHAGAEGFLPKPFAPPALVAQAVRLLARARGAVRP